MSNSPALDASATCALALLLASLGRPQLPPGAAARACPGCGRPPRAVGPRGCAGQLGRPRNA
eukprot:2140109-Alexandrium_andersonii.AAC.1